MKSQGRPTMTEAPRVRRMFLFGNGVELQTQLGCARGGSCAYPALLGSAISYSLRRSVARSVAALSAS